ncbi:putative ubiquinol-cytochrome c reductase complex ubiquinone-binding protein [Eutypa lata UCREL1]|uniref:Cytochrome b-c1 complex subunit 8 n=1 Tax=Eutypa lata (strain UCR-EL1) TaxID=1287681 RepID=M7SCX4_EUTLA|nr:putative ubiquinol-cytochrome c reductase complex ubiquinone-binding protein [Eutypa lata UCREL1]
MRPTQALFSGDEPPVNKYGKYLNKVEWGNFGCVLPQRGIITYSMSPNRQNPLAGAANAAVFNTWRRFSKQVLYWAPPLFVAYYAMKWADERNEYLNSKAGRVEASGA